MEVREVRLKGIVKKYGRFTLSIDSLSFEKGTSLVVGPNGSGKTTLIKVASGLVLPKKGSVQYILDRGGAAPPEEVAEKVSVVLEEVELPPIRVYDLLEAYIGDRIKVNEVIEEFELGGVTGKRYNELSSGFKKRVQLAIGMSRDPEVLFIDEPFTNIDPYFVPRLRGLLKEMARDRIVVVISHQDLGYVPDKIVLLNEGRIVYEGPGQEAYRARVKLLVRAGNKLAKTGIDEVNHLLEEEGSRLRIEDVEVENLVEKLMGGSSVYTKR